MHQENATRHARRLLVAAALLVAFVLPGCYVQRRGRRTVVHHTPGRTVVVRQKPKVVVVKQKPRTVVVKQAPKVVVVKQAPKVVEVEHKVVVHKHPGKKKGHHKHKADCDCKECKHPGKKKGHDKHGD